MSIENYFQEKMNKINNNSIFNGANYINAKIINNVHNKIMNLNTK